MNSEQFAQLLLQSTRLDEQDVKEYLERLESRMQTEIVSSAVGILPIRQGSDKLKFMYICLITPYNILYRASIYRTILSLVNS